MTEFTSFDEFDAECQAERAAIERLFMVKKSRSTPISDREDYVRRLAASLFINYFDVEQRDEVLFGPGVGSDVAMEYIDKADKMYEMCGDFETAKRCIRFLQVVDPKLAKEVVAKL